MHEFRNPKLASDLFLFFLFFLLLLFKLIFIILLLHFAFYGPLVLDILAVIHPDPDAIYLLVVQLDLASFEEETWDQTNEQLNVNVDWHDCEIV